MDNLAEQLGDLHRRQRRDLGNDLGLSRDLLYRPGVDNRSLPVHDLRGADADARIVLHGAGRAPQPHQQQGVAAKDHWMGPEWPCRWYGVTCPDQFGDPETIYLESNEISGTLPAEIGGLNNLRILWMYDNDLSGSIPSSVGNLSYLKQLNLESNQLSGNLPTEIGNLSKPGKSLALQ